MNGMIRFTAAVNKVNPANPRDCLEETLQMLEEIPQPGCDIAVFPKLALSSASCGNLFLGDGLLDACEAALQTLMDATQEIDSYLLIGLPLEDLGRTVSAMAVLHRGELVALIPTTDNPPPFASSGYSDNLIPPETVFSCGRLRFCVLGCDLLSLPIRAASVAADCDLLIVPACTPMHAGLIAEVRAGATALSRAAGCAVAIVNGGVGETSSPHAYVGFSAVYECGEELAFAKADSESFSVTVDLDVDIIRSQRRVVSSHSPSYSIRPAVDKTGLLRRLYRNPWLPVHDRDVYLDELFDLQARSLASRLENTGLSKLVLGVSGGLDSTAALLASAAACDRLGLPRKSIVGVTMPGFGTSDHTYYNALALLEKLGATSRDISIRTAVQQHFEDIGHTGAKDTVYENAQARERTQILFDIANAVGGIVVGSGDLSEAALGFTTFGGDHLAGYDVNICIPKTVLQELVRRVATSGAVAGVEDVVADVLDTPVSPELLPPGDNGEIAQKTEELLGPYRLFDFFLYYFVNYRFRPSKLYFYACAAFAGEYPPAYIKEKLALFFKRFCAGQFKRACAPDAAAITAVHLSAGHFTIPSDLDPTVFLQELDAAGI